MSYESGTAEVGEAPAMICAVPEDDLLLKNTGDVPVFLGGPGVTAGGFPLDPGETQRIPGGRPREIPVVPSPPADRSRPRLYGVVAGGAGTGRVSWIAVSMAIR